MAYKNSQIILNQKFCHKQTSISQLVTSHTKCTPLQSFVIFSKHPGEKVWSHKHWIKVLSHTPWRKDVTDSPPGYFSQLVCCKTSGSKKLFLGFEGRQHLRGKPGKDSQNYFIFPFFELVDSLTDFLDNFSCTLSI